MRLQSNNILIRLGASFLVVGAILLITPPALAAGARANYLEVASWETGYQAQYTVANDGPGSFATWTITFDLPTSNTISSSWDSVLSRSGQHLVFNNAAWNGDLQPGTFTTFGFVVMGTTRPVNCTINGGPCETFPAFTNTLRRGRSDEIASSLAARDVRLEDGGVTSSQDRAIAEFIVPRSRRSSARSRRGQRVSSRRRSRVRSHR
jgi:hypothetical protein